MWKTSPLEQSLRFYLWPWVVRLFVPERLSERRGSFGGKALDGISNMQNTYALRPIYRYIVQYVPYTIISERERRSSTGCSNTFDLELFLCVLMYGTAMLGATAWKELWREGSPWHFKQWKYKSYESHIFKWCSICSMKKHMWKTRSLEQRLLIYLWQWLVRLFFPKRPLNEGGFLAGRLSMTFQTCKIPRLWGQYFVMLLN